jgi:hypothetical protein
MKRTFLTVALLLSVALALALTHYTVIDRPFLDARFQLHNQIIDGTAISPYRYRVLIPFAAEGLIGLLKTLGLPAWRAFSLGYGLVEGGLITVLLASMFLYLRQWFGWGLSVGGVLAVAVVFPLTLLDQYLQPWTYLETALLALTLASARSRHKELLGAVCVLLASLNRETGIFAALGYLLVTFDFERFFSGLRVRRLDVDWRSLLTGAGLGLIWLVVFLGLRAWRGSAAQILTMSELWAANTQPAALLKAGLNWLAFTGFLWMFALPGLRAAPVFFRRLAWLLPFYLLTVLAWGLWSEVRLLLPLYVILLPPGLFTVDRLLHSQEPAR